MASGQGFDSNSTIQLSFDGSTIETAIVSDTTGSFSHSFLVPSTAASTNTITAIDSSNREALAYFNRSESSVNIDLIAYFGSQAISPSNYFEVSYVQGGVQQQQSVASSVIEVAPDIGSTLTISAQSSASNSGEIWCFAISGGSCSSVSIVVGSTGSENLSLYYYDLLSQSISYSVVGAPLPSTPALNYSTAPASYGQNANPIQTSMDLSQSSQTIWALRGTSAGTQTPVSGDTGERWATAEGLWSINSAGALPTPIDYYQQYSQMLSYIASETSRLPTLDYTSLGTDQTLALPSLGANFWADEGSSVSISSQIAGSNSQERWIATRTSWTILGPDSTPSSIMYFHQYNITLSFKELGGGSFELPSLSYTSFGNEINSTLQTQSVTFWINAATTYSISSELRGSSFSSNSRFITPTPINDTDATGSNSSTIAYYHQYLVNISYSLVLGGDPANPSITASVFGSPVHEQLDNQTNLHLWVDSGSSYSIQEFLPSSSQNERWITFSSNGTFASPSTMDLAYYHQYYLNVSTSQPSGGSVTPLSGWFNATFPVTISASPNSGWQLKAWSGLAPSGSLYSGNKSSVSIALNSPTQETAIFYIGIVFDTTDGGSIAYNYGGHAGSVPPNSKTTIYIPPGTIISIAANPTFFVYKFAGWSEFTRNCLLRT